jgi:hypothetical protein
MLEQWFLDLDGVRSGPYQTSEVLSLIAEGEVLPHHQISKDLKSQNWITVLDWRLSQNKTVSPVQKESPAVVATLTPTPAPVPTPTPTPEPQVETIEISKPEITTKEPTSRKPISPTPPPIPEIPPISLEMKVKPAAIEKAPSNRDAMAEMFDMLQTSKHKREQKSQQPQNQIQTPTQATIPNPPSPSSSTFNTSEGSSGNFKLILIGVLVVVIGFFLGQYFQKINNKQPSGEIVAKPIAPKPLPVESINKPRPIESFNRPRPTPMEPPREFVDRSNEKITIRSKIPPRDPRHEDMQDIKDLKNGTQSPQGRNP